MFTINDFTFYFNFGWRHIISWDALDHILFIVSLSAIYLLPNYKQVLILVTAFTIGHSITLVLSVYNVVYVKESVVEFLIPLTIMITCVFNFFHKKKTSSIVQINYLLALFFGLIHGLAFATTIKFMLAKNEAFGWCFFSFNIGLEFGQLAIVTAILLLSYFLIRKFELRLFKKIIIVQIKQNWWVWALSAISFIVASKLLLERFFMLQQ
jgi:HupE / UreJ protein